MKKLGFAFAIVATLVVALLSTGNVYAQGTTPPAPQTPGNGYGRGSGGGVMNNGGVMSGRGIMSGNGAVGEGILHDGMIAVYAETLGISVDDLTARLNNGETISQIAVEKGLTAEQFSALMADARSQAVDQAVKDGTLTQEQADWMKTRGSAFGNTGARGAGRGGMRGQGAGMVDCPYYPQTNP